MKLMSSMGMIAVLVVSAAAQSISPGNGTSRPDGIEIFFSIDRQVATIGESVVVTVELLASPRDDIQSDSLKNAFLDLELDLPAKDFEMVRSYKPVVRRRHKQLERSVGTDLNIDVLHLRKQFVVRPKTDGLLELPGVSFESGKRAFSTQAHQLHVYRLQRDFLSAQRAVVPLLVESRVGARSARRFFGSGSAFLVAENVLVTAYHVVVNAHRITATLPNGRRVHINKVWSIDPERDVAILYIDPGEVRRAELKPLQVAPREPIFARLRPSETDRVVFTTGWPDGIQQSGAGVLFQTVQLYNDDAIWLSSNRVRPGDSGGPLLDRQGRVIGVVSYGMSAAERGAPTLENVSTATDPRPALAQRHLVDRPKGLRAFRDDDFFERYPQARAMKVMSLLTDFAHLRRRSDPGSMHLFLEELDSAVKQSYGVARLHFLQGSIYQMLGDYDQATGAYRRALFQRTRHYPAAYSLAYCQLALRSYDVAADLFDFTTHFEPYRDLAEYGLAQAKMQLLRYDDAVHLLRRVLHQHEDFAPALYLLGRAHIGNGDDRAAARVLVKLEELSPGWADLLERSIRLSPFRPVTRVALRRAKIRVVE